MTTSTNATHNDVPLNLQVAYDFAAGPEVYRFPPTAVEAIRNTTPTFYSTFYGGFWVFTRYDDVRAAFQDHDLFVPDPGVPNYGADRFIPVHLSRPEHSHYRRIEAPIFAPSRIRDMESSIRAIMRRRLLELRPKGEADLVTEFTLEAPSAMFCAMLDLPLEQYPFFRKIGEDVWTGAQEALRTHGPDAAKQTRMEALEKIKAILTAVIAERRAAPGKDIISMLVKSDIEGRPLNDDELLNMTTFLFFAGTDSTSNSINYAISFLATHPTAKQTLIDHLDDSDYVWNASEELLRLHGFHHIPRRVTRDAVFAGVQLRQDDIVMLTTGGANRDPAKYPNPSEVDFERSNAKTHLTFGAGIHRCSGSILATLQLRIALEEIHRIIPDYALVAPVTYVSGGQKMGVESLRLTFSSEQALPA